MVISATSRAAAKILTIAQRKARQKVYDSKPKRKAKAKARQSTPEYKAKQKVYLQRPENKAKQKARQSTPEFKAQQKAYREKNRRAISIKKASPEVKAKARVRKVMVLRWQRPEVKAKIKARQSTPEYKAKAKAYRQRPEVKARLSYLRIPQVRLKRKLTRQRLGYTLNVNLKLVDHKTGTLKKQLTRKERRKLGWVGNFFAPGIAVGGVGLYGVSNKRGRR